MKKTDLGAEFRIRYSAILADLISPVAKGELGGGRSASNGNAKLKFVWVSNRLPPTYHKIVRIPQKRIDQNISRTAFGRHSFSSQQVTRAASGAAAAASFCNYRGL